MNRQRERSPLRFCICLLVCACLTLGVAAWAQSDDNNDGPAGYQVSERAKEDRPAAEENGNSGPVRLARIALLEGTVRWRAEADMEWSEATINLPLRQNAQIFVEEEGRAELVFDDGSTLRLGSGALVTLQTLYSDADGEFTQIRQSDGLLTLNARHKLTVYQVDTPFLSVKAVGPAKVRVGVGANVEVTVRQGEAKVEGRTGQTNLGAGDYLDVREADAPFDLARAPRADSWDRWNEERDRLYEESRDSSRYLPPNIAPVAPELDDYGSWRNDTQYGWVWYPRATSSDWRPYYNGRWVWVNPFGWTWVSKEPWGWAPYHYGTWARTGIGWAWVPGPAQQYWSPAVVHFSEDNDRVAWVPLAPGEVRYPARLDIGLRAGNWSLYFSIGQAAVYYPSVGNIYVARPWRTPYVNRNIYVNNVTNVYNTTLIEKSGRPLSPAQRRYFKSAERYASNHNTYWRDRSFVPRNARDADGITLAEAKTFGGRGRYEAGSRSATAIFQRGRHVAAPPDGENPAAGPSFVKPDENSLTPSREFVQARPPMSALSRPVYRAPLPRGAARSQSTFAPANRASAAERLNYFPKDSGEVSRSRTPRTSFGQETATPPRSVERDRAPAPNNTASSLPSRPAAESGFSRRPMPDANRNNSNAVEESVIRARASMGLPPRVRRESTPDANRANNAEVRQNAQEERTSRRRYFDSEEGRSRDRASVLPRREEAIPPTLRPQERVPFNSPSRESRPLVRESSPPTFSPGRPSERSERSYDAPRSAPQRRESSFGSSERSRPGPGYSDRGRAPNISNNSSRNSGPTRSAPSANSSRSSDTSNNNTRRLPGTSRSRPGRP